MQFTRVRISRAALLFLFWLVVASWPGVVPATEPASPSSEPRVLILSLDGVSYRIVERARQQGAFEGWPPTLRLVSTFPSMTNVAFTAIYTPFGVAPIRGYEMRYYDPQRNMVRGGGPIGYKKKSFAWKKLYHVISHTNFEKSAAFTYPRKNARAMMAQAEQLILESDDDLVLAHIESTDTLAHFNGDDSVVGVVLEVADWLADLVPRHEESRGRPLEVVLLSDHGNTDEKVKNIGRIHHLLRKAGLNTVNRLERPGDVVAPTYGVCSFGVLYTDPAHAEQAARTVTSHPAVELAAWVATTGQVQVVTDESQAMVEWRDRYDGRRFRYLPVISDPLRLVTVNAALALTRRLDADGFASEDDWFEASLLSDYPDAPRRLVDSLTGTFVSNPATVIFSLAPGTAWGRKPAQAAAQLMGGDLEGTHGGLDAVSTLGFFLTNDSTAWAGRTAVAAAEALEPWAPAAFQARESQIADRRDGEEASTPDAGH